MIVEDLVTRFLNVIAGHLKEAEQYAKEDVRSCQGYLKAASAAIVALEAEYDQILVQAKITDLNQGDEVKQLYGRIETYLTVDKLRPMLQEALSGLKGCREALEKNADRFLQWPWKKDDRQQAIKEFTSLLGNLDLYLTELGKTGFGNLKYISGVGATALVRVQNYLRDYQAQQKLQGVPDQADFFELIHEIQKDRTKDYLMNRIDHIENIIHKLIQAFR